MAHAQQEAFVKKLSETVCKGFFKRSRVLEVGSYNVNGSIRKFFKDCDYTGIDCREGPDVDVVSLGHEFRSDTKFDVVCSCETFEHDPYVSKTIANMLLLLRHGGLFFSTCATEGRGEHGTERSGGEVWGPDKGYYKNVTMRDMLFYLRHAMLTTLYLNVETEACDLYCFAIKE